MQGEPEAVTVEKVDVDNDRIPTENFGDRFVGHHCIFDATKAEQQAEEARQEIRVFQ